MNNLNEPKPSPAEIDDLYLKLKKDIYSIYADCPLLDEKYKNQVREYLDDFYSIISDPKARNKVFLYPCSTNKKVVIKGMKE